MMNFIPVNSPLLNGNESKYLNECIESGWISSEGPFVEKFETKFCETVDRKYGVAVSSGTAALDIAIEALGIKAGDEVIVPTFTIISCIAQILRCGAIPIFVDSDIETWNMDISQVESKITSKTKAIMVVHIYGLPVDIDPILRLAQQNNLWVIEDAAQMLGQTYKNRPCGSFGDISVFSFYPNKHITTGEGGMLVTNNEQLATECHSLKNLCFQHNKRFVHDRLGWNYRMTNMQAALGLAQLEQLENFIDRKRAMGLRYHQHFSDVTILQTPLNSTHYAENIYWVFGLVLNKEHNRDAAEIAKTLGSKGIGTRPFFYPMHQQPIVVSLELHNNVSCPVSEHLYKNGFYIPSGLALSNEEIDRVAEVVLETI